MYKKHSSSWLLVLFLMAVASFAFAGEKAPAGKDEAPAAPVVEEMTGKILLVGTSHFPVIQFTLDSGDKVSLGGEFQNELKRLQKVTLKVKAVAKGNRIGYKHYEVIDFEILDIGKGVKPYFGLLQIQGESVLLKLRDAGDLIRLTGNSKVLELLKNAAENGGRAWVTGTMKNNQIKVKKFRILSGN